MSTTTNRSILLVHGRDFKPPADVLMDISLTAMRAGIERDYPESVDAFANLSKDIAYYGDLTNEFLEAQGKIYDPVLDEGDRKNALTALSAIPQRKRFGIRQYDRLPGKSALREFLADVFAPLLGAIGLTMPLIRAVSKDCAEYLVGTSGFAEEVRKRVRDKLCEHLERNEEVLLITHGLGCLVAYDVLWELSHDPKLCQRVGDTKVDTWVTLGAPLGDMHVRKYLMGAKEKEGTRFPTNVITWYNVAAEDDYACHDNTLADDFKKMLQKRIVSAVRDYRIYNFAVRYGKSNPHSSVGYYIHPRVSKILVDWMNTGVPGTATNSDTD
jgi:hypothetical protein